MRETADICENEQGFGVIPLRSALEQTVGKETETSNQFLAPSGTVRGAETMKISFFGHKSHTNQSQP